MDINVYHSIEEMAHKKIENYELKMEALCLNRMILNNVLHVISHDDGEALRRMFAAYCKLLESKTVYIEKPIGVSKEIYREAMLRAIRAENEVDNLKFRIDRMKQSDRPPHYNLDKGDKIAYKHSVSKDDIKKLMELGLSQTEIANRLQVSRSTIYRRLQE